ncbi:zinc ribbon domain-containing protein [Helicobacter felistomachi]|uniref:zinc ribbon domain-containing protein n=1 Tax=Helicobacter felistomachi TaxID=3040201 RepID=UPI00257422A9|nr:zinc ribbon domain-containing protein [Helicobacter sp. NHP21005]
MVIGLIKSVAFVPSSKTCSSCGALKEDLSLKDRERAYNACQNYLSCGFSLDRDFNASIDVHRERACSWSQGCKTCLVGKP